MPSSGEVTPHPALPAAGMFKELMELAALVRVFSLRAGAAFERLDLLVRHGWVAGQTHQFRVAGWAN